MGFVSFFMICFQFGKIVTTGSGDFALIERTPPIPCVFEERERKCFVPYVVRHERTFIREETEPFEVSM